MSIAQPLIFLSIFLIFLKWREREKLTNFTFILNVRNLKNYKNVQFFLENDLIRKKYIHCTTTSKEDVLWVMEKGKRIYDSINEIKADRKWCRPSLKPIFSFSYTILQPSSFNPLCPSLFVDIVEIGILTHIHLMPWYIQAIRLSVNRLACNLFEYFTCSKFTSLNGYVQNLSQNSFSWNSNKNNISHLLNLKIKKSSGLYFFRFWTYSNT